MRKVLALLLMVVLALASVAGYLVLTEKIIVGERRVADGQKQIEEEQLKLEAGKAKLDAGKLESSEGKEKYERAHDNLFLVLADKLLRGGRGFKEGRERIADGDKRVADGEDKIDAGERQLEEGRLELRRGMERLRLAEGARAACAVGAALFASLSIALGFRWRRSLARIFTRADI